jgi:hypothetical protein
VEDDPILQMLAVKVVEEAGFVTLEVGDADEELLFWDPSGFICYSRTATCPEAWTVRN